MSVPPASPAAADPRAAELRSRARGCLLGGALGDALGAPVEFLSLATIRLSYGPRGVEKLEPAWRRVGAITDDTQMTLFTAEGLIRAWVRGKSRGIGHPPSVVHHAYRRWLHTQGVPWQQAGQRLWNREQTKPDGWLVEEPALHSRRAPGTTCLAALEAPGELGTAARNRSKGCGAVMRMAPVGLLRNAGSGGEQTAREGIFRLAVEIAALTHGHPSGQLPAGVLAATIHGLVHDRWPLERALDAATELLVRRDRHEETARALEAARKLAADHDPTPRAVESLGGGWVAEEALAIAVYAALSHPFSLPAALRLAANHSGDSDSTASICGNLLGAALGESALPDEWLAQLEARDTITQLADDLALEILDLSPSRFAESAERKAEWDEWWRKYPGW